MKVSTIKGFYFPQKNNTGKKVSFGITWNSDGTFRPAEGDKLPEGTVYLGDGLFRVQNIPVYHYPKGDYDSYSETDNDNNN